MNKSEQNIYWQIIKNAEEHTNNHSRRGHNEA